VKPESATSGVTIPATTQDSMSPSATTKSSKTLRLQSATAVVSVARKCMPLASSGAGDGRNHTTRPAATAGSA
jgi:hypothetical protein